MSKRLQCAVPDCSQPSRTRGWCVRHYALWKRNGKPERQKSVAESFDEHWQEHPGPLETPCHVWLGQVNNKGYVHFRVGRSHQYGHRFAWQRAYGPIPPGLCVRHRCDVPACVNPEHLELGTQRDNIRDRDTRGRHTALRGEKSSSAKLNATDVERIRDIWRVGGPTQKSIARYFGVAHCTVNAIIKRRIWAHT